MAKQKKVNTLDLIQQMTQKNKETVNVLKDIKNNRSISPSTHKQQFKHSNVREVVDKGSEKDSDPSKSGSLTKEDKDVLKELSMLLGSEAFNDKKDTFVLSLSGDCLAKYEKLATGTSYKLGIKTSRNDLIRKVLEGFIHVKYEELIRAIEQK